MLRRFSTWGVTVFGKYIVYQRLNRIIAENKHRNYNLYNETTIMKFDSGREHGRRMIGIFLVLMGMRGNFEGTRNRVIDG